MSLKVIVKSYAPVSLNTGIKESVKASLWNCISVIALPASKHTLETRICIYAVSTLL